MVEGTVVDVVGDSVVLGDVAKCVVVVLLGDATGYVLPGSARQTTTVRNPNAAMEILLMVFAVSLLCSMICLPCNFLSSHRSPYEDESLLAAPLLHLLGNFR